MGLIQTLYIGATLMPISNKKSWRFISPVCDGRRIGYDTGGGKKKMILFVL